MVLAGLLAGCGLRLGARSGPGPTGPVGKPCATVAECPKPAEPCMIAACVSGGCTTQVAPAEVVPEEQTPGDCKQLVCDGRGETFARQDPDDTPPDDGNDCTDKRCTGDTPEVSPRAAGAVCKVGVCNGKGGCGECLPGKRRCERNAPQACSDEGQWSKSPACSGAAPVCGRGGGCVGLASLALGDRETCVRLGDGSARCWGSSLSGKLESGGHSRNMLPSGPASNLALGAHHACAVAGGAVWCWGENGEGQVGDGTRAPGGAQVLGVKGATRIAAGDAHTCALLGDGAVWCWGRGRAAPAPGGGGPKQKGPPPSEGPTRRTTADFPGPFAQIVLGGDQACGRLQDGFIECWGAGAGRGMNVSVPAPAGMPHFAPPHGKGGRPPPPPPRPPPPPPPGPKPAQVRGLKGVVEIAAGGDRTCARLREGTVTCWSGATGTLEPVKDLSNVVAIAVGKRHACALLGDGSVSCWGDGSKGQLGYDRNEAHKGVGKVPGVATANALAARGDHTCARLAEGSLVCWGDNDAGELGDGTNGPRTGAVAAVF